MDVGKEKLAEVVERLRRERDELRVKVRLGTMEARDEWQELEEKWKSLESRVGRAKEGVVETSRELAGGVDVVVDELTAAYRRIRERLDQD